MRLSFKQLSEKKTQQNTLRKDKIIALAEKQLTDFSSLISDFQHQEACIGMERQDTYTPSPDSGTGLSFLFISDHIKSGNQPSFQPNTPLQRKSAQQSSPEKGCRQHKTAEAAPPTPQLLWAVPAQLIRTLFLTLETYQSCSLVHNEKRKQKEVAYSTCQPCFHSPFMITRLKYQITDYKKGNSKTLFLKKDFNIFLNKF